MLPQVQTPRDDPASSPSSRSTSWVCRSPLGMGTPIGGSLDPVIAPYVRGAYMNQPAPSWVVSPGVGPAERARGPPLHAAVRTPRGPNLSQSLLDPRNDNDTMAPSGKGCSHLPRSAQSPWPSEPRHSQTPDTSSSRAPPSTRSPMRVPTASRTPTRGSSGSQRTAGPGTRCAADRGHIATSRTIPRRWATARSTWTTRSEQACRTRPRDFATPAMCWEAAMERRAR